MPCTSPCPAIFSATRVKISRGRSTVRATSTGRLASPSFRNGTGFGMTYSTVARNSATAASNATCRCRSSSASRPPAGGAPLTLDPPAS